MVALDREPVVPSRCPVAKELDQEPALSATGPLVVIAPMSSSLDLVVVGVAAVVGAVVGAEWIRMAIWSTPVIPRMS